MIVEMLQTGFMQRALLAGMMIAVVTSTLGVFLVLRKLSLIGDGLAHASFGGIAIGLLVGVNAYITGLVVAVLGSVGIHRLMERAKAYGDSAIALILSTGMAVAVVIISYVDGFTVDIFSYLFGSILMTSRLDLAIIAVVLAATVAYTVLFYRQLVYYSFNRELAQMQTNSRMSQDIFIVLIALAVVISIRAVGILLVTALVVVPPLTALQVAESFKQALIYSVTVGVTSMVLGIMLAYVLDLAPSGVIVLVMVGFFLLTQIYELS